MADVTLTAALRSNLLSLQGTQTLLDKTQFRLATGKKVNTALDNASSFFSALNLNNRASDLSALLDSQTQAIQVLKAADAGITSLTALVKQAQGIVQSAQSSLSTTAGVRSGDVSSTNAATYGTTLGAGTVLFVTGGVTSTLTIAAGESISQIASNINALTGYTATVVDGTATAAAGSKRLEIRATGGGTLTLATGTSAGAIAALQANNAGTGGVVGQRLDTGAAIAASAAVATSSNTADSVSLEKQYKVVYDQITQLVADTGYKGTNLLNGDTLNVQFNESNSSKLSIAGVTFNATGLGLSYNEQNPTNATSGTFFNSANITSALNSLTSGLSSLRQKAQAFGNNLTIIETRKDFTSNIVNTLKEGADALTVADKNEEGANLLALQTTQQLGIQALSLASQANQSVLRLFS